MTAALPCPPVTRWWWVRHARIAAGPGLIAGRSDLPADLTDGPALDALATRLPAGAVWLVTDLCRSRDTARALLERRGEGSPLRVEPDLTEQDFGRWQGQTHAAVTAAEPERVAAFWRDPAGAAPPEGESFAALARRTAAAIDRLCAAHAGCDLVMVGHAGPIRAAVGHALGVSPERMLALVADCLHVTRLDHIAGPDGTGGQWRVQAVNSPPAGLPLTAAGILPL